jgi:hypothetical protein
MQPYFFPYIGYIGLAANADRFVLLDDVQYIRHGWVNRNRILKPGDGWQYVTAPLNKHSGKATIREVELKPGCEWRGKLLRQLEHYKKRAPNYEQVMQLLETALHTNTQSVTELNLACLNATFEYLDTACRIDIASHLDLDYSDVAGPGDWALVISEQLGASSYMNPEGGMTLFDPDAFAAKNINLFAYRAPELTYSQRRKFAFEPNLSIIDAMMYVEPETIRNAMADAIPVKT